jgi:hypothetical protein
MEGKVVSWSYRATEGGTHMLFVVHELIPQCASIAHVAVIKHGDG